MNPITWIFQYFFSAYKDYSPRIRIKIANLIKMELTFLMFTPVLLILFFYRPYYMLGLIGIDSSIVFSLIFIKIKHPRTGTYLVFAIYFFAGLSMVTNTVFGLSGIILEQLYFRTAVFILFYITFSTFSYEYWSFLIQAIISNFLIILSYWMIIAVTHEIWQGTIFYLIINLILLNLGGLFSFIAHRSNNQMIKMIEEKTTQLTGTLTRVIEGFVPICSMCKSIKGNDGKWHKIEEYIKIKSQNVDFTHGLCDDCAKKAMNELNS